MAEQPAASALADFLNEYRHDHAMGVSCANLMDAAADLLRTQCTEDGLKNKALEWIADECQKKLNQDSDQSFPRQLRNTALEALHVSIDDYVDLVSGSQDT